ncbi:MAG: phage tail protein [Saprospiraceae bacterium]|nr:phage tail protein [Saprospiraceae bacterium]
MEPFIGQIAAFGFNFAPKGWAMCNGQLLAIAQNSALFSLIGTYYGGDGISTFALPDLRGRVAINQGQGPGLSPYSLGQRAGSESVTLNTSQIPAHNHIATLRGNGEDANSGDANNKTLGAASANIYNSNPPENGATLNVNSLQVAPTGGNQPHSNMQPYLVINYCIALQGIFPPRN